MYTIYLLCLSCRVGIWITLTGGAHQVPRLFVAQPFANYFLVLLSVK